MTPSEIKPGMKFGNWEVIKFSHHNKHRIKYYLCRCCVCGTERPVRGTALLNGTSTSCSSKCSNFIIGQRFGHWVVLSEDKNRKRYVICQCDCGKIKSVFKASLTTGKTKSCGCVNHARQKKMNAIKAKNHIGEKYGHLTIIDYELRDKGYWYKCKCDCGNLTTILGKNLFFGTSTSCGCLNSRANELMDKILTKKKIPFKREVRFNECKDKNSLPFDFAIYNNQEELLGLMELNGSLHYSSSGTGWDTTDRLIRQQKHDYIKRKFCEDNMIPFLVIPYQYFDELEKFLITSDFWKIITENFND